MDKLTYQNVKNTQTLIFSVLKHLLTEVQMKPGAASLSAGLLLLPTTTHGSLLPRCGHAAALQPVRIRCAPLSGFKTIFKVLQWWIKAGKLYSSFRVWFISVSAFLLLMGTSKNISNLKHTVHPEESAARTGEIRHLSCYSVIHIRSLKFKLAKSIFNQHTIYSMYIV